MKAVKKGGNRQELHEAIREHSMAAGRRVKVDGLENDLIKRIAEDPLFGVSEEEISEELSPKNFVGCAPMQVSDFLENTINPLLQKYKDILPADPKINV